MLLRQSEPADADHYISAVAMGSPEPTQDTTARADPLDDVFGSDDGDDYDSPAFGGEDDDDDDDDDDDGPQVHVTRGRGPATAAARDHPSDIHRLRQEHTTAGYREGITVAKASSIQAGFDEGFGLGATIGLKVGYLLGVLEGIAAALARPPAAGPGPDSEAEAGKLLSDARAELDVRSVFSQEYWNADGTWKYEVAGQDGGEGDGVVFSDVTEAHPLVRKWTLLAEAEMRRWGLEEQLPLLQRRDEDEAVEAVAARVKPAVQTQPDAKAASDALSW